MRLLDRVDELEETVRSYLNAHDLNKVWIGGYDVFSENGQIMVKEVPFVPVNQLRLPLEKLVDGEF